MKIIITTYHVSQSAGFTSPTENPVAIAFRMDHPDMDNVRVHNNRLTASREGFPVRFLISGYTTAVHKRFLAGSLHTVECELKSVAVVPTVNC